MKLPALAGALVLFLFVASPARTGASTYQHDTRLSGNEAKTAKVLRSRFAVRVLRDRVWYLQDVRHAARSATRYLERNVHHLGKLYRLKVYWWRLAVRNERLTNEYQRASRASHLAGWRCITNGAYPGAPHEGNGVNGPYSGPLGMTNPWMGHSGDWVHMNPSDVYAVADREAAKQGYSYSWMQGQWPNTFPPCAHLF